MSISSIIIIALILLLTITAYFAVKFAFILMKLEDALEKSLEILDTRQEMIAQILEIPLFFDSVEVRKVHADIEDCRNSILDIAKVLTENVSSYEAGEATVEEKENKKKP
tara:strand:+ start:1681 stop:2010 length:330 start_codon:yes stop_codon:yes gene_type:complete